MTATRIEWTHGPNGEKGEVWNPVRGCSRVSDGCSRCYAERQAHRFSGPGKPYEGLTTLRNGRPGWTGAVRFVPEMLDAPLRWRNPRMVFVNSMSDLFHERVTDEQIAAVFGVMAASPQHTFQVLTKRPERIVEWFEWLTSTCSPVVREAQRCLYLALGVGNVPDGGVGSPTIKRAWDSAPWPLPNVWLGVSVENQAAADERIPLLLQTPAAVRWISAEPLLGPLLFDDGVLGCSGHLAETFGNPLINWIVVGSESGPGARPMDENWVRSIREQCIAAGVPLFYKQRLENGRKVSMPRLDGVQWALFPEVAA